MLQGVISNYDTDLFTPLIKRAAELTGTSLKKELDKEAHTKSAASLRVIADHSRAATFLISDGVTPSNEGRGYVLRKIIRRAITHGRLLGPDEAVPASDGLRCPRSDAGCISGIERNSRSGFKGGAGGRDRFARTLDVGLGKLEELLESSKVEADNSSFDSFEKTHPYFDREWIQASSNGYGRAQSWISGEDQLKQLIKSWFLTAMRSYSSTSEGLASRSLWCKGFQSLRDIRFAAGLH